MRSPSLTGLSHHLFVHRGVVNVGVLHRGEEALLIDLDDGAVLDALEPAGIRWVDAVLFTHHHRDSVGDVQRALQSGAWLGTPEAERALFEEAHRYWQGPRNRWHLYHFRPHSVLAMPISVHRTFIDGDRLRWFPARITVLSTPGHTDGSVTYLVDVDGQRIAFCGDLIYDEGQILELYSLQKGFGELMDYHGFMSAWREVIASLRRIQSAGATVLVPAHGNIIRDPKSAIDLLESRLEEEASFELVVMNHSPHERAFRFTLSLPESWKAPSVAPVTHPVPSYQETRIPIRLSVPANVPVGRWVITVGIDCLRSPARSVDLLIDIG